MNNHYVVTQNIICTAKNTTEMHFFRAPSLKTILCYLGQKGSRDAVGNVSSGVSVGLAAETLYFINLAIPAMWHLGQFGLQEARTPERFGAPSIVTVTRKCP